MEARASGQTLRKRDYPESRGVFSGRAFISVSGAPGTCVSGRQGRFMKHLSPLSWGGGESSLLQNDLMCEYIPTLKGNEENSIRNLCMLK